MGISGSLVLIAVGAILKWAVTATVSGLSLDTVGVILMVVGVVGLVLSVIFWSTWGGFGGPDDHGRARRADAVPLARAACARRRPRCRPDQPRPAARPCAL